MGTDLLDWVVIFVLFLVCYVMAQMWPEARLDVNTLSTLIDKLF